MEQERLTESTSQKSATNRIINIRLFLFILILIFIFFAGGVFAFLFIRFTSHVSDKKTETNQTLPSSSLDSTENLAKDIYLRILSLSGNSLRTWSKSSMNGYDVCGYNESQIKEFIDIKRFEGGKYFKVGWENAEWSPGCKYLYFEALLNGMKGTEHWLYSSVDKKLIKLPNYNFFGFVNDNFILSDGLEERVSYLWESYKLFDIQNSKIVADIGLSNYRFRNSKFPWSFNYGPTWTFLYNESEIENGEYRKVVFKVNNWWESLYKEKGNELSYDAGVLESSRNERVESQIQVEFYAYVPEIDKEKYESQTEEFITNGSSSKTLSSYVKYYPKTSGYPSDKIINCDQWFIFQDVNKASIALRIANKASEKDCLYDITGNIVNHWVMTNQFEFVKEF